MAAIAIGLASWWAFGPASNTTSAQSRPKAFTANDLGAVTSVGGLNSEAGGALTSVIAIPKTVNTAHLQIPTIVTIDPSACRRVFEIDTQSAFGASINDNRIVVGTKNSDAFEWLPDQCSGSTQRGSLPRLPNFDPLLGSSRANANNNARDTVGGTAVSVLQGAAEVVPTLWRKIAGGFAAEQLPTGFMAAPFNDVPQPGEAFDINEQGTIVGFTTVGTGTPRACIFRRGQNPQILQKVTFLTNFTLDRAHGISNNGFITGIGTLSIRPGFPFQSRGFVRSPGGVITTTLIPDNDGQFVGSVANKINSDGIAVGKVIKNDTGTVAGFWNENGHFAFLTTLNVDGLADGTALTEAVDINDNGDILARGSVNGEAHAFVLRPTGDPTFFWPVSRSY
jgi:uncharacterized membrane protein